MTETRVKDVFPMNNGIMSVLSVSGGYDFNNDMDIRLLATCGKRCITPVVEMLLDGATAFSSETLNRLALLILSEYKETWDKVKDTLNLEYNPLSASIYEENETTESEGENSDTNNETSQNEISATDVLPENYISDGKNTNQSNSTGTNRNTSTRTLRRTSNSTSYKPVDLLKSEIDMRIQNRFSSRVIEDVKNYIAMPIY